jgi:hypothetical protein
MGYRWKPNATQRKAFAEKMKDPDEKKIYEDRKWVKTHYSNDPRSFKHKSFIPTQFQYDNAMNFLREKLLTSQQEDACNQVISGFICQNKIHHDYIHIVNELTRNN